MVQRGLPGPQHWLRPWANGDTGTLSDGGSGAGGGQRWGRRVNLFLQGHRTGDGKYVRKLGIGFGLQGLVSFVSNTGIGSSTMTYSVALLRPELSGSVGQAVVWALPPAGPHRAAPPAAVRGIAGVASASSTRNNLQQPPPLQQPPSPPGLQPIPHGQGRRRRDPHPCRSG